MYLLSDSHQARQYDMKDSNHKMETHNEVNHNCASVKERERERKRYMTLSGNLIITRGSSVKLKVVALHDTHHYYMNTHFTI